MSNLNKANKLNKSKEDMQQIEETGLGKESSGTTDDQEPKVEVGADGSSAMQVGGANKSQITSGCVDVTRVVKIMKQNEPLVRQRQI